MNERHSNNSRNVKELEAVSQEPGAKSKRILYSVRVHKIVTVTLVVECVCPLLALMKQAARCSGRPLLNYPEDPNPIHNRVGEAGSGFPPGPASDNTLGCSPARGPEAEDPAKPRPGP